MKRRNFLGSTLVAVPALGQEKTEAAPLAVTAPDAVASAIPGFFPGEDLAALRRLGEILMPAGMDRPGAKEAGAAEFLDFLIAQSPPDRQALYREGAARLNKEAQARHSKPFAALSTGEAEPILAPLREAWTYQEPKEMFARFLRAAKDDFFQATVNSRPFAEAMASRSRGAAGVGLYWLPIE
jgi:hypothetical protein